MTVPGLNLFAATAGSLPPWGGLDMPGPAGGPPVDAGAGWLEVLSAFSGRPGDTKKNVEESGQRGTSDELRLPAVAAFVLAPLEAVAPATAPVEEPVSAPDEIGCAPAAPGIPDAEVPADVQAPVPGPATAMQSGIIGSRAQRRPAHGPGAVTAPLADGAGQQAPGETAAPLASGRPAGPAANSAGSTAAPGGAPDESFQEHAAMPAIPASRPGSPPEPPGRQDAAPRSDIGAPQEALPPVQAETLIPAAGAAAPGAARAETQDTAGGTHAGSGNQPPGQGGERPPAGLAGPAGWVELGGTEAAAGKPASAGPEQGCEPARQARPSPEAPARGELVRALPGRHPAPAQPDSPPEPGPLSAPSLTPPAGGRRPSRVAIDLRIVEQQARGGTSGRELPNGPPAREPGHAAPLAAKQDDDAAHAGPWSALPRVFAPGPRAGAAAVAATARPPSDQTPEEPAQPGSAPCRPAAAGCMAPAGPERTDLDTSGAGQGAPRISAPPAEPPSGQHAAAARQLSFHLAGTARQPGVEVRVREQAGELRVSVRTADSGLSQALREGLPELVDRLGERGFEAQAWKPAGAELAARPSGRDSSPGEARLEGGTPERDPSGGGEQRRHEQPDGSGQQGPPGQDSHLTTFSGAWREEAERSEQAWFRQ